MASPPLQPSAAVRLPPDLMRDLEAEDPELRSVAQTHAAVHQEVLNLILASGKLEGEIESLNAQLLDAKADAPAYSEALTRLLLSLDRADAEDLRISDVAPVQAGVAKG
ncbi:hypothetical protein H696_01422 [Fonticula alba]|uniref:Uncharacterized protein n=1 Tax=Fonticula alba TaxID=691883 RepID=A0A058ZC80_FONAL|nr:hypothetical protein H696_01422 [Fonticula alba]KCV72015.1 hypothetical protein H696_01422 [Fonticula alba]|eukprot:XP_009493593.1 hypothetical protein H696_01422 [Fonticula alba]